jgi:hypothetical protein
MREHFPQARVRLASNTVGQQHPPGGPTVIAAPCADTADEKSSWVVNNTCVADATAPHGQLTVIRNKPRRGNFISHLGWRLTRVSVDQFATLIEVGAAYRKESIAPAVMVGG